jgi:hypothetical protein
MQNTVAGIVENGKIRLLEDISLPEQTKVQVVVPNTTVAETHRVNSPRLADPDQATDFRKTILEMPADAEL